MMTWLRRLHAWAGLALCLLMAVLAMTGALLVFEPQIRDAGRPTGPPPPPALQANIATAAQSVFGDQNLRTIVFASNHAAWTEVRLKGDGRAWMDDQGRPVAAYGSLDRAFDWIFDLHHHLLAGEIGTKVTGWIGVAGLAMVVSGLILWWPARRSFQASVVPARPSRAGWLAAHRDLAVMAAPLIALSMLTGVGMALPDIVRPLLGAPAPKPPEAARITPGAANWPQVLANAQARFPNAVVRMAVAPAKAGAPAAIRLRQPKEWHANGRTIVWLDPPTGRVLGVYDAEAQGRGARVFNALWPVHAARVGGLVWQLLMFASGLGLMALSLYGGEAYRRKLRSGLRA